MSISSGPCGDQNGSAFPLSGTLAKNPVSEFEKVE
jgi:hypothetical protein